MRRFIDKRPPERAKHFRVVSRRAFVKEPSVEIRVAAASDIDSLVEFNRAMALETENRELDAETLRAGVTAVFSDETKGFYAVAEEEGKIVAGLMVTYEWSDWRDGWFWWIQSVYTLPEHRAKGIYRRLYEFVKERAEARNVCGFRLYVENTNNAARSVYETLGMFRSHYLMYEEEK
ncbi:MAG: GNAT family N-acetyltransferase [Acidobacteriota bacterium]